MSYRKFKADYLFDGFNMHESDAVLVCGSDGTIESIEDVNQAGGDLEIFPGILSPGFINCHCHLELSYLKARIPEKQGLVNFLLSVISHRNRPAEGNQEAMLAAETDMLHGGIVAVGDICNTGDTLDLKSAKRLNYYNFIELLGWAPRQAFSRYEAAERLAALFAEAEQDEKHMSLSPHAPYSVSDELWNLMAVRFRDKTITIHNQESAAENEFFKSGSGDIIRLYSNIKMDTGHFKAPGIAGPSNFLPKLSAASSVILVHNTYMEDADLKETMSLRNGLFFCLCPNANMYIEDHLPDISMFQKNNACLVLGTDSLASNHQLSMIEEMKTIKKTFPQTTTAQLLLWATSNGASALSFEEKLGDFKKGKKPGIVLTEHLHDGEITGLSTSRRII